MQPSAPHSATQDFVCHDATNYPSIAEQNMDMQEGAEVQTIIQKGKGKGKCLPVYERVVCGFEHAIAMEEM